MEKKESANWNIAATHWLTAGFAFPATSALFLFILFNKININSWLLGFVLVLILVSSGVFAGITYSANYIKNKGSR